MNILWDLIKGVWALFLGRRQLRVLVHRAFFFNGGPECYFVNATNLSHNKEFEITHVWVDCSPQVHILRPERPLPKRLRPDESWETWIEVAKLPAAIRDDAYDLIRVRLSTGKNVKSHKNEKVPPAGFVAGA
jgi:hypothetical protein